MSPKKVGRLLRIKYWIYLHIGSRVVAVALRLLYPTLRVKVKNPEIITELFAAHDRIILAFWHGNLISMALGNMYDRRCRPLVVLVSPSRDGEITTRAINRLGLGTVRGSSSKRAIAGLKEMLTALKERGNAVIAVDGPRGPRHEIKPGVLLLAKLSQAPIMPVSAYYSNAWAMNSWDQLRIAKPFSTLELTLHQPLLIPPDANKEAMRQALETLDKALHTGND
jgi:lysophospholipid acyltransferase (LPLAT)-like uncharacterized protein